MVILDLLKNLAQTEPKVKDLGIPKVGGNTESIQGLLNIIFGLAGVLAVLVIVFAAFTLAANEGDPEKISRAKKAIIYSLVGLAIIITAAAIVNFVLGKV